ncbi:unnamed protein product, partial [marine sediment metagenome]
DLAERKRLAQKAFQHVAIYDTAISQYLQPDTEGFPDEMTIALKKRYSLRYGENPHQAAAFYAELSVGEKKATGITWAEQLWGKELSFNNILDADAAWRAVTDFAAPTVAIIKHNLLLAFNLTLCISLSFCLMCHCEPKAKQSYLYLLVCFVALLLTMTSMLQGGRFLVKGLRPFKLPQ